MSAKAIREADGKAILGQLPSGTSADLKFVGIDTSNGDLESTFRQIEAENAWLNSTPLVAKPDMLLKRRGKAGLVLLDANWETVKQWVAEKANKDISADNTSAALTNFVVEPFVKHTQGDEHYVCIRSIEQGDEILFAENGGVDVGDVDEHAISWLVPEDGSSMAIDPMDIVSKLPVTFEATKREKIAAFIAALYQLFIAAFFTYLEINPIAYVNNAVHVLDIAARVDSTAEYLCRGTTWPAQMQFPPPFGRVMTKEEAFVASLDANTGASLKFTVLNPKGRVWTMVAGGGASVAYADAIVNFGFAHELANYGEYSGAPSEAQTYAYARTIIDLMTRGEPVHGGKVLLIGGGIANFTNVAATFKGIIRALSEAKEKLIAHNVVVWVRRGGPNYQEGLRMMRELGSTLGVPIRVYGPETHITAIVPMALQSLAGFRNSEAETVSIAYTPKKTDETLAVHTLFNTETSSIVYGLQTKAVQSMLDFDYMSGRASPSVAAIVSPFDSKDSTLSVFYGAKEFTIPVYTSLDSASNHHKDASVLINFASQRSVFATVSDCINNHPSIKTIAVIAEGVPERLSRQLGAMAKAQGTTIIGPATVGGVRAGAFKIGNTGGMIDNIESAKLYRGGSVCYVSKSGGMSNEMNSMMALEADGVAEGVAIGGDHFPGTTFVDHLLRYESDPACKILVLLGEVGGAAEYDVAKAIKSGQITKPLVAWVMGTSADALSQNGEFQFGHAGAMANGSSETAAAKNAALKSAGVFVPPSFEVLPKYVHSLYKQMLEAGEIPAPSDKAPMRVPMDYDWARELGLIRRKANMVSTISDDRGAELKYASVPITKVISESYGIGGTLALLWFRRQLPKWATDFIEMVIVLTADHGPAVSGAHNTIVAARAGKDLVSSLASGLLTIGDRFGGALDEAAAQFTEAFDSKKTPAQFVSQMRKQNRLISGIGHKVKSKTNPDMRVTLLTDYALKNFPSHPLFDYAREVEALTTAKKDNLILNVDGATAVLLVDMLRHSGCFTAAEADEYIKYGFLNGLFIAGRTIGFIGHFIDQRRNNQPLYRHPWEDIRYVS